MDFFNEFGPERTLQRRSRGTLDIRCLRPEIKGWMAAFTPRTETFCAVDYERYSC